MKISLAVILTGLAVAFRLVAAAPETAPAPGDKPQAEDLDTLVRALADDSFRVREKATRDIWELGETALPALQEASTSADPEQVFRARELIRKIQLHITPDTDPAVIALVERFAKASISEKTTLFTKLRGKRAWRQMLKLYAAETRAEVREKLQPAVNGIAIKAARERLYQGDAKEAREFLEMAPADAEGLLALAEFHRSHGTLDAELQLARSVKGRKSDAWQIALQRAAGNCEAARDAALAAGETSIAAAMAALAGDPLPWLRTMPGNSRDAEPDTVGTAYAALAAKRWQGQKSMATDIEPLIRPLGARNTSARLAAMNALFLLGEAGSAEAAFTKSAPLAAFRHFDALEHIPEALKSLGLDPDHPDYPDWIDKHLRKFPADDIENQRGPSDQIEQLVALANFLERKGLHDVAAAAFTPPLTALADKNANRFVDLLAKLFGTRETLSGAPRLARNIGVAWAGDDEKRWDDIVPAAFGDDDQAKEWWSRLADLDPAATRAERFDAMLALFGLGPDPAKLREKWLALAWKAVDAAPAGQRDSLVGLISTLCFETGDVANSLKAWDLLPENNRKEVFWGEHILHLSAADRWDDAAQIFLKQIALAKEAKQDPSAQLHAYAAATLRQAGRPDEAIPHDQWADQLALGNATVATQIANGYAFGRDYERAAEWWARAAREADPDSGEFAIALKLHTEVLLEQGKWREAAAASEVLARVYVSADYRGASPLPFMHQRLQADMARALANLANDRMGSLAILEKCYRNFASDGTLADFFFPALRKAGLLREHDEWFGQTWTFMQNIIASYPQSDNTRNTAAWFASRALRNLDEAEQHLTIALAANPHQSAYLDTMAEIQFAKGNRDKALEWSKLAVNFLPDDSQLRRQQQRFRSAPLPQ
jgi:hypothetical protein